MAAWLYCNVVGRFNEVHLRRGLVSTVMGDRLQTGKLHQYFTKPLRPTQPPTLSGTGNEYQPNAVMLCGWGVKACVVHSTRG